MPSRALKKRVAGVLLMVLGVFALSAPLAAGRWSLAVLGIPLMALSVAEAYAAFASPRRGEASVYLPSVLAMLAGTLLLLSSALVLSGLRILLFAVLVIDGFSKILTVWRQPHSARVPHVINGLVDLGCAALLWYLIRIIGAERAIGIIIGAFIAAAGWRMLMVPAQASTSDPVGAPTAHPDPELGLSLNEVFARLRAEANSGAARTADLMWMLTLGGVFLAIHIGRMPISDSLLGISSPFVATAGDLLMTLVFATLIVLPLRLLLRRLTRPVERLAWSLRLGGNSRDASMNAVADRLIGHCSSSICAFAKDVPRFRPL
jgi:uncharacterized membrane protein HdeD (DUF308 family)